MSKLDFSYLEECLREQLVIFLDNADETTLRSRANLFRIGLADEYDKAQKDFDVKVTLDAQYADIRAFVERFEQRINYLKVRETA